jgi:hypothetical protein
MTSAYLPNTITLGPLTLNAQDGNGVWWYAEQLTGWGSPKGTLNVTQKPRDHGGWRSESFLTPRVVTVAGTIAAPNPSLLARARHALNAAVSLTATPFSVTEYGETLNATVTRQDEVLFGDETETWTSFSIQLVAVDPRRYGQTQTVSTNMASATGGMTFGITFPVTFPSTVVSGTVSFNNPGNIGAPVVLTVHGPVTGPIITHVGSGNQIVFASSLALASGEYLVVDMAARTVKANGQASRIGYVTQRGWFQLDPGGNDISYAGAIYDATSTLDVTGPNGAYL